MVSIVQKDDPQKGAVLRTKAVPIGLNEIATVELKGVLTRMQETLQGEEDGVALAAPQIGVSKRIFIISPMAYDISARIKAERSRRSGNSEDAEKEQEPAGRQATKNYRLVYINPRVVKVSKEKKELEEGCLSVRPLYGKVKRSARATVEALDENGNLFTQGATGLMAQIFQHETDHLDGILFVDKAKEVREMPPQKNQ